MDTDDNGDNGDNTDHTYVITQTQDSPGSSHDFEVVSVSRDISKDSADIQVVASSETLVEKEMDVGGSEVTVTTNTVFEIPGMDTFEEDVSFDDGNAIEVHTREFEVPLGDSAAGQTQGIVHETETTDLSSLEMRANKFLYDMEAENEFNIEVPPTDSYVVESTYNVVDIDQHAQPVQTEVEYHRVVTEYNVLTDEVEAVDSSLTEADQSGTQQTLEYDPMNDTVESSRTDNSNEEASSETNPFLDGDSLEVETETKTTVVYTYESIDDNIESTGNLNTSKGSSIDLNASRGSAVDLDISRGSGIDLDVSRGSANDLSISRDSEKELNVSKGSSTSSNPFLNEEEETDAGNPFLEEAPPVNVQLAQTTTVKTETHHTLAPGGIKELHKLLDTSFQSDESDEAKAKASPKLNTATEKSSKDKIDGSAFMAPLDTMDTPQPISNIPPKFKVTSLFIFPRMTLPCTYTDHDFKCSSHQ